ncbi:MAG: tyrosine-type recombinase/integrase [Clostridiales bacterium]|nr:tyrosine-type recombinase/integrase [Clostridiales bacterium]MCF8023606.1 tyrosine-type recombinase/integrase [Clostridiales bacterium]
MHSDCYHEFLEELYVQGASKKTIDAYKKDLLRFARWYKENNNREPEPAGISGMDLRGYQDYLQEERELKPATINRYLVSINSWLTWAKKSGNIANVPPSPKQLALQKSRPKSLETCEQKIFLQEVESCEKYRDAALVRVLLGCGLRVSEAVTLKIKDLVLDDRKGKIIIRRGKGNKWREVPVPVSTRKVIKEWLAKHKEKYPGCTWVFPNRFGNYISTRYVELLVEELARRANLKCSPHVLRHTCATNMLRAGVDLVTVAEILGHNSLDTTAIYTRPGEKAMMDAVEKAEIK